ncbi:MAG: peptidoglycan DD-metalloendopeptidase family protein [Rikenellaceae bacterium]
MRITQRITLIIAAVMLTFTASAQQSKIDEQRKIIATLEKQVADGEKQIASIRKGKEDNQLRAESLAAQVEARKRLLTAHQQQADILRGEIIKIDRSSRTLSTELDSARTYYGQMVREAYRNYQHDSFLAYLFTSTDLRDMNRKISNLRAVSQMRERQIASIDSLSIELKGKRTELSSRKSALDSVVAELSSEKDKLERDVKSAQANIKQMSERERSILQQRELQKRQLDNAIEELRKLSRGNTLGADFSNKTTGLNLPVSGGRVKRYKENMAEIVGGASAKITAIYDGKVVDIRRNRITGKYDVYIAHGEYIASYAGLSSVSVAKESVVHRDEAIGVIGQAVDVITMQSENKIVFGIYPPDPKIILYAANLFKR